MHKYQIRSLYVGLFLMNVKNFLSMSAVIPYNDYVDNILVVMACLSFVYTIFRQGYSIRTLILYGMIGILCIYSSIKCGDKIIAITVLTCLAIRKENLDVVLKKLFQWQITLFFIHTTIVLILFACNLTSIYGYYESTMRFRVHLGFVHPNLLAIFLLNLCLISLWINFDKIDNQHLFLYFIEIVFFWLLTDSNTMLITGIVYLSLVILSKKWQYFNRMSSILAFIIVPFLSIFMLRLVSSYKNGDVLSVFMNAILNNRIKLGAYIYNYLGGTLFGQPGNYAVEWDSFWGITSTSADSTYTSLMMINGWIWLVLICISFSVLAKRENSKVNIMIIVWAVYAVTEVHVLNCYSFFPILLVVFALSKNEHIQEMTQ